MPEQSLAERLHSAHRPDSVVDRRAGRMKLMLGALVGLAAAAGLGWFQGPIWALPGLAVAAACAWAFFRTA